MPPTSQRTLIERANRPQADAAFVTNTSVALLMSAAVITPSSTWKAGSDCLAQHHATHDSRDACTIDARRAQASTLNDEHVAHRAGDQIA